MSIILSQAQRSIPTRLECNTVVSVNNDRVEDRHTITPINVPTIGVSSVMAGVRHSVNANIVVYYILPLVNLEKNRRQD